MDLTADWFGFVTNFNFMDITTIKRAPVFEEPTRILNVTYCFYKNIGKYYQYYYYYYYM